MAGEPGEAAGTPVGGWPPRAPGRRRAGGPSAPAAVWGLQPGLTAGLLGGTLRYREGSRTSEKSSTSLTQQNKLWSDRGSVTDTAPARGAGGAGCCPCLLSK